MVANFVTYEKVLLNWCYSLKDLSYLINFLERVKKMWPKSFYNVRKVKLQAWQFTFRTPPNKASFAKQMLLIPVPHFIIDYIGKFSIALWQLLK